MTPVVLTAGAVIAGIIALSCKDQALSYRTTNRVATFVYAIEGLLAAGVAAMCIVVSIQHL